MHATLYVALRDNTLQLYGELPKFVLRCSYEAALRKGVTTASMPLEKGNFISNCACTLSSSPLSVLHLLKWIFYWTKRFRAYLFILHTISWNVRFKGFPPLMFYDACKETWRKKRRVESGRVTVMIETSNYERIPFNPIHYEMSKHG